MNVPFRVGVTRDFLKPDGTLGFGDIGLGLLENAGLTWEFVADNTPELRPDQVRDCDGLLVLGPRITSATLEGASRLRIVARFGVGYDSVDVDACTQHGVLLTITPDAVRRPVAAAAMTFLLALSHKLWIKDRLTRSGRWGDKLDHMGMGLTGRTLGVIGFGNIGRDLCRLAGAFDLRCVAFDPYLKSSDVAGTGVDLLSLDDLLRKADFVCICCALTPETRHLINGERLALMKPTAYLINVARGPIVDQKALTQVLKDRRIQGAGLDVFEKEPIDADDPLLQMEHVIVAPHALCWTDECFLTMGRNACQSLIDVAAGREPRHIVNRDALTSPMFQEKLRRWRSKS